jgi:hypothetical protein
MGKRRGRGTEISQPFEPSTAPSTGERDSCYSAENTITYVQPR